MCSGGKKDEADTEAHKTPTNQSSPMLKNKQERTLEKTIIKDKMTQAQQVVRKCCCKCVSLHRLRGLEQSESHLSQKV